MIEGHPNDLYFQNFSTAIPTVVKFQLHYGSEDVNSLQVPEIKFPSKFGDPFAITYKANFAVNVGFLTGSHWRLFISTYTDALTAPSLLSQEYSEFLPSVGRIIEFSATLNDSVIIGDANIGLELAVVQKGDGESGLAEALRVGTFFRTIIPIHWEGIENGGK